MIVRVDWYSTQDRAVATEVIESGKCRGGRLKERKEELIFAPCKKYILLLMNDRTDSTFHSL